MIVAFLGACFCEFKPTVFLYEPSEARRVQKTQWAKIHKNVPPKTRQLLENFLDTVENDETKLDVSMYLCWMNLVYG